MSISQQQIQERAFRLANTIAIDGHNSPVIDNTFTPEDLFPHALRDAYLEHVKNPGEVDGLKRAYTLTFNNGVIALPNTVLTECLNYSQLTNPDNTTLDGLISYQERYLDYLRPAFNQLGYYAVNGVNLEYTPPYGQRGAFDGDMLLTAVGLPDIPASLATAMNITSEVAETVIMRIALGMKGVASAG